MSAPPARSTAAAALGPSVFASLQTKIDAQRLRGGTLVPLHIGDTHLDPIPAAHAALAAGTARDLRLYGSPAGLSELNQTLVQTTRENGRNWIRTVDQVHVTCGATQALLCATRALLNPGDQVLVLSPYWPLIRGIFESSGVGLIEVPLLDSLYREAVSIGEVLEQKMGPRVRAIYFASPNNPNGYILDQSQLEQIARFAVRHNLWVMSDEVYCDYAYARPHQSIAELPGMPERTVVAHSFSKSHGLAGIRVGYLLSSEDTVAAVRRFANYTLYNVPVAMQRVALAVLGDGDAWQSRARQHYEEAKELCCERLLSMGVRYQSPHGGSFVFCDFSERLGNGGVLQLLEAAIARGVLLAPGRAFGADFEHCGRLCFTGVDLNDLKEGLERLAQALDDVV